MSRKFGVGHKVKFGEGRYLILGVDDCSYKLRNVEYSNDQEWIMLSFTSEPSMDLIDPQYQFVKNAMRSTWSHIGSDVVAARAECEEYGPVPQAEVIEMVLDCDRILTFGGNLPTAEWYLFTNLTYAEQKRIAEEVFTAKSYE